jgi:hypothetical protein
VSEIENKQIAKVDVSFERQIIESEPGIRQRALAVQALLELSDYFDSEPSVDQIEAIRGLSKKEAKAARKALEKTVLFIGNTKTPTKNNVVTLIPLAPVASEPVQEAPALEDVETEPLDAVEIVETTSPVVEVPTDTSELTPLSKMAVKFLRDINRYDESVTSDNLDGIINEIVTKVDAKRSRLDYGKMLHLYFEGVPAESIAETLSSTPASISKTISRIRTTLVREVSAEPIIPTAPEEVVEKVSTPVPQPPIKPVHYVFKSTVDGSLLPPPVEILTDDSDVEAGRADRHEKLKMAVTSPEEISTEDWLQIAQEHITELAERYISQDEAEALWAHLHLDEDGKYTQHPRRYEEAINNLRPRFRDVLRERFDKESVDKRIMGILFNASLGWKNLDDLHELLNVIYPNTYDKELIQRQTVLTFSEFLRP